MSAPPPGRVRGPGASWLHAHGLEVTLALPLVTYLLVLTAAPIVETVRLSLGAPLEGRGPSLERYRALLTSDLFRAALRNTVVVSALAVTPRRSEAGRRAGEAAPRGAATRRCSLRR